MVSYYIVTQRCSSSLSQLSKELSSSLVSGNSKEYTLKVELKAEVRDQPLFQEEYQVSPKSSWTYSL
jgi:hypothetical protein